jgi:very-short-patch-repair endonuclease
VSDHLEDVFRGSVAVAAGAVTPKRLRGPRFQRLFPDIYAPAHLEPDLKLRSRAAALLVAGRGVLAGYSAAEVHGASCASADAPAEVLLLRPGGQSYRCAGLRVHRDLVDPGETVVVAGMAVTGVVRTAFDLIRWAPTRTEKVVAADALAYNCALAFDDVRRLWGRHPGAWGGRHIPPVLELADGLAESPMESRLRMALWFGGLPRPAVQFPVPVAGRRYLLDLAYPAARLGVEYDGDDHRTQARARRDLAREAALVGAGWKVLRFDAGVVRNHPNQVAEHVRWELARRRSAG